VPTYACEFVSPLLEPDWNRWIREFAGATFFHTAEWARVLAESYRYPLHYAVSRDSSGRIVALLPAAEVKSLWTGCRGVCLPFSDECAPLLAEGVTLESAVGPVKPWGMQRGWDYLELRGGAETLPGAVQSDQFMAHNLDLEPSSELQFKKLKDSHRRNIRKAAKEDIEVHRFQTIEAMDIYYALHCLTRKRQGVPPQPVHFFRLIAQFVIQPGHGFVSLARFRGQWISGAVYFRFGSTAIYKFGASDRAFQHLRANNLVMWDAISHFREEGVREFSFGRTDPSDSGLLQFKRGWGAREIAVRYHRLGLRRTVQPKGPPQDHEPRSGVTAQILRRLPIPLLRILGSLTYRHVG
jgi:hypothetical protein